MNVYWAIPYKTVTFSEEKRQKPNMFFRVFHKLENNGLCDIRNA